MLAGWLNWTEVVYHRVESRRGYYETRDDCFEFYEKADYNLEQEIEKIQFTHTDEIIISSSFTLDEYFSFLSSIVLCYKLPSHHPSSCICCVSSACSPNHRVSPFKNCIHMYFPCSYGYLKSCCSYLHLLGGWRFLVFILLFGSW